MSEPRCIGINCLEPASIGERCRDCDIEHSLDSMECSVCKRMRYRRDERTEAWGQYFWGDRCECDPRPPSTAEARKHAP